ncbi:MAG: HTH-type quorum sensing-dependent transcriptional regulator RpaR [Pseudomonas fluorescens]|nr:MAG: HTH-type quorum sensing-dependent transcriptional regulator RpaR [Pseudomonas fluorescens]
MTGCKVLQQRLVQPEDPSACPLFKKRSKPRPRAMLPGQPLTPKEMEILHWAAEGKTVWEISKIRAVSQATVKFHLRNIYAKLQVSNRVQAVNHAVRHRLFCALKKP